MFCIRLLVKETFRGWLRLELLRLRCLLLLWWSFLSLSTHDILFFVHLEVVVDEDLGNFLLNILYGFELFKLLRSAEAASEWKSTLLEIVACWRMSDSKRALGASLAFRRRSRIRCVWVFMAFFTVPFSPMTEVDCNGAAVHAFPVDSPGAVLFAGVLSVARVLQEAGLADQVFLLCRSFHSHFLFAVNEASKVRLGALGTLEEASFGLGESSQVVIVEVAWGGQALVFIQALLFDHFQCLCLHLASQSVQLS